MTTTKQRWTMEMWKEFISAANSVDNIETLSDKTGLTVPQCRSRIQSGRTNGIEFPSYGRTKKIDWGELAKFQPNGNGKAAK